MKKYTLIILSLCLLVLTSQAQETILKYADLSIRPSGAYDGYESKDGILYKIGDKITLGVPSKDNFFSYIYEVVFLDQYDLGAERGGQQAEIKRIDYTGDKRVGYQAVLTCKGEVLSTYKVQIEKAIATGEIESSILSSDAALAELKKAKDKLDLELITQEEYDKIKAELSKFIK